MLETYLKSYKEALFDSVVPFWLEHCVDREFGGGYGGERCVRLLGASR